MSAPATVLVADDDRLLREMVRDVLVAEGYRVLDAKDGLEAVEVLAREKPDLVLLDLLMPNMSGLDVLARLPSLSPSTRVLVITSLDTEGLMAHALGAGAHGFVGKPFHPLELADAVASVLEA